LHLLIDSTGIKSEGEGELFAKKHGPPKPRQWSKVHLGIDVDALMLPELLNQIPADQPIGKVSADGACDTRASHAAIAARSACAVIPARKNARPWLETTPGAQASNEILSATRRLGRTI
jgi:hypothetical protein